MKKLLKSKKVILAFVALVIAILTQLFPEFGAVIASIGGAVTDFVGSDTAQAVSQTMVE